MSAIFRREMKMFFANPIGYIVLAVLYAVAGYYFWGENLYSGRADLGGVFNMLFSVSLLVLPLVTMRLFSEEKKQRTDQALLTAPTGLTAIVLGKFFAAMLLFLIGIAVTLVFAVIIAFKATPDWMVIIGNFVGLLLVGGMIIAIGLLISSLTESQVIAGFGALGVSLLIFSVDTLGSIFRSFSWITAVTEFLSVSTRYNDFTSGVINYDNIVFFLSIQALFLFLTVRVLDSKRWK